MNVHEVALINRSKKLNKKRGKYGWALKRKQEALASWRSCADASFIRLYGHPCF